MCVLCLCSNYCILRGTDKRGVADRTIQQQLIDVENTFDLLAAHASIQVPPWSPSSAAALKARQRQHETNGRPRPARAGRARRR